MIDELPVKSKKFLLRFFFREKAFNICYKGDLSKKVISKGVFVLDRNIAKIWKIAFQIFDYILHRIPVWLIKYSA